MYDRLAFAQDQVTCNINGKAGFWSILYTVGKPVTEDIIANKKLLKNIRAAQELLTLYFNAGITSLSKIGNLNGTWVYGYILKVLPMHYCSKS